MALTTTGLVAEFVASLANGGTSQGVNSPTPTGTWKNTQGASNGTLTGSWAFTSSEGWAGSGTAGDPYCLKFNAADHVYVALPNFGSTWPMTLECWGSTTHNGGWQSLVGGGNSTAVDQDVILGYDSNGYAGGDVCNNANVDATCDGSTGLGDSTIRHLVLTIDSSHVTLYLNGVQQQQQSTPANPTTIDTWSMGAEWYDGSCTTYLTGAIATVRVYNIALSQAQVTANYNAGVLAAAGAGTTARTSSPDPTGSASLLGAKLSSPDPTGAASLRAAKTGEFTGSGVLSNASRSGDANGAASLALALSTSGTATTRVNLLPNPSFEGSWVSGIPNGYSVDYSALHGSAPTFSQSASNVVSGTSSWRMQYTSAVGDSSNGLKVWSPYVACSASTAFTFILTAYTAYSSTVMYPSVNYYDTNHSYLSNTSGTHTSYASGSHQIVYQATTPVNTAYIKVGFVVSVTNPQTVDVFLDALLLESPGSAGDAYFDGSTVKAGYLDFWSGTANNSSSIETTGGPSGSAILGVSGSRSSSPDPIGAASLLGAVTNDVSGSASLAGKYTGDTTGGASLSGSPVVTRGLVAEFAGALAAAGTAPGNNSSPTSTWKNLRSSNDALAENTPAWTASDGWEGTGTASDPYAFHPLADDFALEAAPHLASTKVFSYEAWASTTSTDQSGPLFSEGQTTSATGAEAWIGMGGFSIVSDNGTAVTRYQSLINDGLFHHIVLTCDGSNARYYVDGVLTIGPVSISALNTISVTMGTIGGLYRGTITAQWLRNSNVATIRLYAVALTSSEVAGNYAAGDLAISAPLGVTSRSGDATGSAWLQGAPTGDASGGASLLGPRTTDVSGSATLSSAQGGTGNKDVSGAATLSYANDGGDIYGSAALYSASGLNRYSAPDPTGSATLQGGPSGVVHGSAALRGPKTGDTTGGATLQSSTVRTADIHGSATIVLGYRQGTPPSFNLAGLVLQVNPGANADFLVTSFDPGQTPSSPAWNQDTSTGDTFTLNAANWSQPRIVTMTVHVRGDNAEQLQAGLLSLQNACNAVGSTLQVTPDGGSTSVFTLLPGPLWDESPSRMADDGHVVDVSLSLNVQPCITTLAATNVAATPTSSVPAFQWPVRSHFTTDCTVTFTPNTGTMRSLWVAPAPNSSYQPVGALSTGSFVNMSTTNAIISAQSGYTQLVLSCYSLVYFAASTPGLGAYKILLRAAGLSYSTYVAVSHELPVDIPSVGGFTAGQLIRVNRVTIPYIDQTPRWYDIGTVSNSSTVIVLLFCPSYGPNAPSGSAPAGVSTVGVSHFAMIPYDTPDRVFSVDGPDVSSIEFSGFDTLLGAQPASYALGNATSFGRGMQTGSDVQYWAVVPGFASWPTQASWSMTVSGSYFPQSATMIP